MPRELKYYLWDILKAGENIDRFIGEKSFHDFAEDDLVRNAVERCFEILGEAMNQARATYPGLKNEISEHKQVVNFRNRIIHGYFAIDRETVWSTAKVYLPGLLIQVRELIHRIEAGAAPPGLDRAVVLESNS